MDPSSHRDHNSGGPPDPQQHGAAGRTPEPAAPGQHQHQQSLGSTPSPMPQGPQGPPQLPPQLFTTAAQLLDLTDKKLVLILRDGRKLFGILRSWDQFANIVLQDAVERLYAAKLYCDEPLGTYLVRGENVLLLGEVDLDREDDVPPSFQEARTEDDINKLKKLRKEEEAKRKHHDKRQRHNLQKLGFEPEHSGDVLF